MPNTQQNKIYAQILESQGFTEEAFLIYKNLLEISPNDMEIKSALKRLKKFRSNFDGVNEDMKDFFIRMQSDEEFKQFEEWLIE